MIKTTSVKKCYQSYKYFLEVFPWEGFGHAKLKTFAGIKKKIFWQCGPWNISK